MEHLSVICFGTGWQRDGRYRMEPSTSSASLYFFSCRLYWCLLWLQLGGEHLGLDRGGFHISWAHFCLPFCFRFGCFSLLSLLFVYLSFRVFVVFFSVFVLVVCPVWFDCAVCFCPLFCFLLASHSLGVIVCPSHRQEISQASNCF